MKTSSQPSEQSQKMYLVIAQSYQKILDVFDGVPFRFIKCREDVKSFMASDLVCSIESKITEQCMIVLNGSTDREKDDALFKIESGMSYLVSLIIAKIEKGKPV